MAGRSGPGSFAHRTKLHINTYLSIRKDRLGKSFEKAELRSWLSSVSGFLTDAELRELLIHLYGDIKPDTTALEILTNEQLVDIEIKESDGLAFRRNTLNNRASEASECDHFR